ncbi:hypothetical protein [Neisseria sicca]|uniref:hypothetical protein n=1 Tax=Neisseria sicca TaxID=490 RepID=UPI0021BFB592|nr:hypothetical protein [Neisseria sicca]
MPFNLNMTGMIPPIFPSTIIFFPSTFLTSFPSNHTPTFFHKIPAFLQHPQALYIFLFTLTIIFFSYFYTPLLFTPKQIPHNLNKTPPFLPPIPPPNQTSQYLQQLLLRLTLFPPLYITTISLIPHFFTTPFNLPFYFPPTSLLILLLLTIHFTTQINSYPITHQYHTLITPLHIKSLSPNYNYP